MIYVLYHKNCIDGFGAAFAAWKKFGSKAKYKPVAYGDPFPKDFIEESPSTIYILDFSYPKEQMLELAKSHVLIVLDHHKTAMDNFKDLEHSNIKATFDMNKSGARLAWEYCHPETEIPELILHIEDRDLWKFSIPYSKEIHRSLISYPMDFELWDTFNVQKLKTEGITLYRMYNQLVENICEVSWIGKIGEDEVPMVNTSIAWSEIGHSLLKKYPNHKYVASFTEFENETMWSLRSREDFDVSSVAKKYGGGGHKQAAGFKIFRR